nr:hypothetical protein RJW48_11755 [Streptococcus suis]
MVIFIDCQNYWLTLPHHTKKDLRMLSHKKASSTRLLAGERYANSFIKR